jgi:hypothetical protein
MHRILKIYIVIYSIMIFFINLNIYSSLRGDMVFNEAILLPIYFSIVGLTPCLIYAFIVIATKEYLFTTRVNIKITFGIVKTALFMSLIYLGVVYFVFFYEKGVVKEEMNLLFESYLIASTLSIFTSFSMTALIVNSIISQNNKQ